MRNARSGKTTHMPQKNDMLTKCAPSTHTYRGWVSERRFAQEEVHGLQSAPVGHGTPNLPLLMGIL